MIVENFNLALHLWWKQDCQISEELYIQENMNIKITENLFIQENAQIRVTLCLAANIL